MVALKCDLPAAWDHLRLVLARSMGPPGLPVMGPPAGLFRICEEAWAFFGGVFKIIVEICSAEHIPGSVPGPVMWPVTTGAPVMTGDGMPLAT